MFDLNSRKSTSWSDGDFGKSWTGGSKPLNPTRDEQVELIVRLAELASPTRILDIGCGPGLIAKQLLLKHSSARYVGIDVSADCIERAETELSEFGDRIELVSADSRDLKEIGGTFDLVLAVQSVHHLSPEFKVRLFRDVSQKLSNSGMFILSDRFEMAHSDSLEFFLTIENVARIRQGFEPYPDDYSIEQYRARHEEHADLPDSIEFHLAGLREAGFYADCIWQFGFRGIIVARNNPAVA